MYADQISPASSNIAPITTHSQMNNSSSTMPMSTIESSTLMPVNTMNNSNYTMPMNSVTAHSHTVQGREDKHLQKELAKESKRAMKQEKVANKLSTKADKQFTIAADKAQSTGMFAERSAMRHEEKAVKLAAAANFHHQAAVESHSERIRAEHLSSLPVRGTLPASAQSSMML